MAEHHPFVSEAHEDRPWFEWIVAALVAVAAVLGLTDHLFAATLTLAVTSIATALVRLALRERSPWKIRSVAFDVFIGLSLSVGLIVTYVAVLMIG